MANFGVAHLPFRQSDIESARAQSAARVFAIKLVVERRMREQRGIAVLLAFGCAAGINAPAVANNEHDWLGMAGALCRRSARETSGSFVDNAGSPLLHRLVKWRNQLLALFCLLAFAGLGVLYFQHWVIQKPFGIILFVGEGLSPSQLAAARVYGGGADSHLALDSMPASALLINYSNDFAAPDSAAAATALATGIKTNNRAIGVDAKGKPVRNIVELARAAGRACGLITNSNLTDVTSAAFYAHASETDAVDELALSLTSGNQFDIILGGGAAAFLPSVKNGARHDERDLVLEMRRNGYDIVQSKADLETVPRWRRPKLFGAFNKAELSYAGQVANGPEQPSLPDMVRRAVELLHLIREVIC